MTKVYAGSRREARAPQGQSRASVSSTLGLEAEARRSADEPRPRRPRAQQATARILVDASTHIIVDFSRLEDSLKKEMARQEATVRAGVFAATHCFVYDAANRDAVPREELRRLAVRLARGRQRPQEGPHRLCHHPALGRQGRAARVPRRRGRAGLPVRPLQLQARHQGQVPRSTTSPPSRCTSSTTSTASRSGTRTSTQSAAATFRASSAPILTSTSSTWTRRRAATSAPRSCRCSRAQSAHGQEIPIDADVARREIGIAYRKDHEAKLREILDYVEANKNVLYGEHAFLPHLLNPCRINNLDVVKNEI